MVLSAYLDKVLPLIVDVYAPAREPLSYILVVPPFIANVALLCAVMFMARNFGDSRFVVLLAASGGFLLTYLIQSKGWMNHAYPGMALALLASTFFLLDGNRLSDAAKRRKFALFIFVPAVCVAPFLFGALIDLRNEEEYPGVAAEVARLAPPHPRIAALAEELDVGHPLVRWLGGTWIGRQNCLWVTSAAKYLLAHGVEGSRRERLQRFILADETMFAEDVARGKPDVLLVETPELETWARREPALSGIFEPYHLAGKVGTVSIWLRDKA